MLWDLLRDQLLSRGKKTTSPAEKIIKERKKFCILMIPYKLYFFNVSTEQSCFGFLSLVTERI